MADKSFGVKQLNLVGSSGTPTIISPNDLNLNATSVAISTDVSIGGQVKSNIIVGTGKSVGIGSTIPRYDLDVVGNISITGTIYQNGSIFSSGVQGSQGPQGAQGFQGVQGSQGTAGSNGSQGIQGSQGFQGPQGFQGVQGSQGRQGAQGIQGSQGFQGIQGSQGIQGVQGATGSGSQGAQGFQGIQGTQGFPGETLWSIYSGEPLPPRSGGIHTTSNIGINTSIAIDGITLGDTGDNPTGRGGRIVFAGTGANITHYDSDANISIGHRSNYLIVDDPDNDGPRSGSNNISIGGNAGRLGSGGNLNVSIGYNSHYILQNSYGVALGAHAGELQLSGSNNLHLGSFTGLSQSGDYRIIIGSGYPNGKPDGYQGHKFDAPDVTSTGGYDYGGSYQLAIGIRTDVNPSKYWIVGNQNFNIGIGSTNPGSKLSVIGDVYVSGIVTAGTFVGQINAGIGTITTFTSTNAGLTNINSTGISTLNTLNSTNATLTNINSVGVSTLDVTSTTSLTAQNLNVSGLSTFSGISTFQSTLFGTQASFTGIVTAGTFVGQINAGVGTITTFTSTNAGLTNINSTGISTLTTLNGTNATLTNINSTGISTLTTAGVTNLTTQQLNVTGLSTYVGVSTFQSGLFGASASFTGIVTATTFYGDGSGLTNVSGAIIACNSSNLLYPFSNFLSCNTCAPNITSGVHNFFVGYGAGNCNTSGSYNNFFGFLSGCSNTTGKYNNFFGCGTGQSNTIGFRNNFFGLGAGLSNTEGSNNNFFGYTAGYSNTTGSDNIFIGRQSGGYTTTGSNNTFIGACAGFSNTFGNYNIFFGDQSGYYNTTGIKNIFIGCASGKTNISGNYNLFLGNSSGSQIKGGYNVVIGSFTGTGYESCSGHVFLSDGYGNRRMTFNGSGAIAFGSDIIGGACGYVLTSCGDGSAPVWAAGGGGSGAISACNTSNFLSCNTCTPNISSGNNNFFVGYYAGLCLTSGDFNNFFGYYAGTSNTTGYGNFFAGRSAGYYNTTGVNNIFIGSYTGCSNTIGSSNIFIGSGAGCCNTNGVNNIFIGGGSGRFITGSCNVVIGRFGGTQFTDCHCHIFISDGAANNRLIINNYGAFGFNGYGSPGDVLISQGSNNPPQWSSTAVGTQGAQGLTGPTGYQGFQGVQGASGSTTLTVKEVASQGGATNVTVTSVSEIQFNNASGFNVTDEGGGVAFVDLGSTFNPWEVDGQTSLSASGEEPVEFIAGSGIVITTDNTSTPKSITFTASGGGGGGGGSTGMDITLGTPTDSSLVDGLLSWTTSTKVTDAIDEMNEILNKLAPAKPSNLSAITLALNTYYSATETSSGTVRSIVTSSTTPQTSTTSAFYDGDSGTLSAWIDGSQATNSSQSLTTSDDSGTYGSLVIVSDTDPYSGQSGKEGFWKQLTAYILSASSLTVGSHTYQMKHSGTGNTGVLTFYIDNPGTPTISSSSSSFTGSTISYISGVPTLSASTTFTVSFTINDAIKQFYNTNQVAIISGSSILSSSVSHQISGSKTNGASITVSGKTCTVGSGKYSETNSLTITPYNSADSPGTSGTLSLGARVDTVSSEGSRKRAGSGQYPSSGYGGSFDSTQSLKTSYTEELQLLNGIYRMPTGDYSSNIPTAGPNYSTGMGSSDRWYLYQYSSSLSSTSAFTISINGSSGISNVLESGMSLYAKVEGVTGWIDCNGAYPGTGSPSANGDPAVVVGSSSATSRRITFGSTPRSGTLYIRIGFPSGSTKSFSSISVSL